MIRLAAPHIDDSDIEAVAAVLRSGSLVQGERVLAFEAAVAAVAGTRHAVAVSNCTVALFLALVSAGVGPGDRVAVSAYSWPATSNVVELVGARPEFVDVDPVTGNMDPSRLEAALRPGDITAVLVVHAFGRAAAIESLAALCEQHGSTLVEDAACALGARHRGRPVGSYGSAAGFSFHPRKSVTTGEGGVLTTDDGVIAARARSLRNHGLDPGQAEPRFVRPGWNFRLTDIQAALGVAQLSRLDAVISRRRELAGRYDDLLAGSAVIPPDRGGPDEHTYQSYVVRLSPADAPRRAETIARMRHHGIETTIGTHHLPLTEFNRTTYGHRPGDFPGTDSVAAASMTLPLHLGLSAEDQEQVVSTLLGCVR